MSQPTQPAASPKAPTTLAELNALTDEQRYQFIEEQLWPLFEQAETNSPVYFALLAAHTDAVIARRDAERERMAAERLAAIEGAAA